MKFVGGFIKFIGILVTLGCTVFGVWLCLEHSSMSNYVFSAFVWVCGFLITVICWSLGSVLTNFPTLAKRTEELEKKYEALLLAQATAYRTAPAPVVANSTTNTEAAPAETSVESATPVVAQSTPVAAVPVSEPVASTPKKKGGLRGLAIGGICVVCAIAMFVLADKEGAMDVITKPDAVDKQQSTAVDSTESVPAADETEKYADMIPADIQGVWGDLSMDGLISLYAFSDDRIETYVINMGKGASDVLSGTFSVQNDKVKYNFGSSSGYSYYSYESGNLELLNANKMEISKLTAGDIEAFMVQESYSNAAGVLCLADLLINYFPDSSSSKLAYEMKDSINASIEAEGLAALDQLRTEYDKVQKITWYESTSMPIYTDIDCYIYPYIGRMDSGNTWLRVKLNYTDAKTDASWIFFNKVIFSVDGDNTTKTINRSDIIRDNDTEVWETADFEPTTSEIQLLREIANSHETIIRFQGDEYHYDHIVTDAEKAAILNVLAAYEYLKK